MDGCRIDWLLHKSVKMFIESQIDVVMHTFISGVGNRLPKPNSCKGLAQVVKRMITDRLQVGVSALYESEIVISFIQSVMYKNLNQ